MKVTKLVPDKKVEWECMESIEEWMGTYISFDLEERDQKTLLRFTHGNWKAASDTFAGCTYDWARFMASLKLLCETGTGTPSQERINVKRINVPAEDGSLRMVISNENRQHPGRINGKDFAPGKRAAGILFFNEEGDECGGLLYWGKKTKSTGRSGMSFTMDQYHNDQVVQIINDEEYNDGKS